MIVIHSGQSSRTPCRKPGFFASLRAFAVGVRQRTVGVMVLLGVVLAVTGWAMTGFAAGASGNLRVENFEILKREVKEEVNEELYPTRLVFHAEVHAGGSGAQWRIEYASSAKGPWTPVASGSSSKLIFPLEEEAHHLESHTRYFARIQVEESGEKAEKIFEFATPEVSAPEIDGCPHVEYTSGSCTFRSILKNGGSQIGTTFANFEAVIETNGAEAEYGFEYATSEHGSYQPVPGAEGAVTVAEDSERVEAKLTGLSPEQPYYIRVKAKNEKGVVEEMIHFTTLSVRPQSDIVHGFVTGVSATGVRIGHGAAAVYPGTFETSWRFEYAPAEPGGGAPPEDSPAWADGSGGVIAAAEAGEENVPVEGEVSGLKPATEYYVRLFSENVNGKSLSNPPLSFETPGSPDAVTFAVHAVHGEALRALGSVRPHGFDTHYSVQYVSQEVFEGSGWAQAEDSSELDAGSGQPETNGEGVLEYPVEVVGVDLPDSTAGTTYRYRMVASNELGVAQGEAETLTMPGAVDASGGEAECPNATARTGPSANLTDCRAYEQVTPVDKEGAKEIFNYGLFSPSGAAIGEDGDHLALEDDETVWGAGPGAGQSPYFFARVEGQGWKMVAAAVQPEASVDRYEPQLFSPDLSQFAFQAAYSTGGVKGESPNVEFKAGAPGGPYTAIVVPRSEVGPGGGWVAASEDFSKLILQVGDHKLLGGSTGTLSGDDLYEYVGGMSRQVNVGLGTCGAHISHLHEESTTATGPERSNNAVSDDGSRVFFEAVPGSDCSQPTHVFMRVNDTETVDLGAYRFLAANPAGSRVLLDKQSGAVQEVFLYETEAAKTTHLFTETGPSFDPGNFSASKDLTVLYFRSPAQLTEDAPPHQAAFANTADVENLYRYDVSAGTLGFVAQIGHDASPGLNFMSPDGRFYYWTATGVAGVPGGAPPSDGLDETQNGNDQVYRYDSREDVVQCMSCASSFDPEPKLSATFGGSGGGEGRAETVDGRPGLSFASESGEFAFFETPSALVPQDVDGEIEPEIAQGEHISFGGTTSLSSDVYEWRRDGVDGCGHLQGCVSLITNGRGGYKNMFLGTDASGRDAFFYTNSQLVSQDNDSAGDIYDARVDGGFAPPPPGLVECEGDECSTPASPPDDPTPSSFTFTDAASLPSRPAATTTTTKTASKKTAGKPKKRKAGKGKKGRRRSKIKAKTRAEKTSKSMKSDRQGGR
jgi:hypothetical protein